MIFSQVHEIAGTALMAAPQISALQGGAVPMVGQGLFDWINQTTNQVQTAISGVLIVVGLIVALMISFSKRTLPGVITGVVTGGLIAGIGGLVLAFSGMAEKEVGAAAQITETAVVVVVEQPEDLTSIV